MKPIHRIYPALAILALLPFTLSAQAVDKKQGAYPVSAPKAPASSSAQASAIVTGPAHPTLFNPQAGIMDTRSVKGSKKAMSSNQVQLKRYQMKYNYPRPGLRPLPATNTEASGLGRHWVAPLPGAGHDYLRGMYTP